MLDQDIDKNDIIIIDDCNDKAIIVGQATWISNVTLQMRILATIDEKVYKVKDIREYQIAEWNPNQFLIISGFIPDNLLPINILKKYLILFNLAKAICNMNTMSIGICSKKEQKIYKKTTTLLFSCIYEIGRITKKEALQEGRGVDIASFYEEDAAQDIVS